MLRIGEGLTAAFDRMLQQYEDDTARCLEVPPPRPQGGGAWAGGGGLDGRSGEGGGEVRGDDGRRGAKRN